MQYRDSPIDVNDKLAFKALSPQEMREGRARANRYLKRRNRINTLIALAIAIPAIGIVWYFFSRWFL